MPEVCPFDLCQGGMPQHFFSVLNDVVDYTIQHKGIPQKDIYYTVCSFLELFPDVYLWHTVQAMLTEPDNKKVNFFTGPT